MIKTHLIAAAAALVIGASGAAWVQAQRYGLQIEKLKHASTNDDLAGTRQIVQDIAGFQKGLNDAFAIFQGTQQRNTASQQNLDRALLDLRTTAAGLRGDFADLPERITSAAQPALAEYATTCTAVFESMASAGGRLAERGARISKQAEGHAADAALVHAAWPVSPP